MGRRYLSVGGSAAGMAAAHTIRRNDQKGTVTVLSNESCAPYFRPMIPYIINGKKQVSDIALDGSGTFTASDIDVRTKACVETVDTKNRRATIHSGETFAYDKLLIATGSSPFCRRALTAWMPMGYSA